MGSDFRFIQAGLYAQKVLRDRNIDTLPVDPIEIASIEGIMVQAKSPDDEGVSGMLLRYGEEYGIAYATHIDSEGFRRFSIAHELAHYFLPGHIDHVLPPGQSVHNSTAGFVANDDFELEADHFAAHLLMPEPMFERAMGRAGTGLEAVEALATECITSLTATAIRYAQAIDALVAAIISYGKTIDYAFMSDELKRLKGIQWMRKGTPLPKNTATYEFNADPTNIADGKKTDAGTCLLDWFNADTDVEMTEEIVGLGGYGRTLTILFAEEMPDEDEDSEFEELSVPRFR